MLVVSHPTGNENVKAALSGFHSAGILSEFVTEIAIFDGTVTGRLATARPFNEFLRRSFPRAIRDVTKCHPLPELARLASIRAGFSSMIRHEKGPFCIDRVCQHIDKVTAKRIRKLNHGIKAIYGYEDASIESFRVAAEYGLKRFYDLPIGYWKRAAKLMSEEAESNPDWASTIIGNRDSERKLDRKDAELADADHVFVASSFTADTLKDACNLKANVSVIPYGFPDAATERDWHFSNGRKRLRAMFVGGLSQRKGISYLFDAVELFSDHIELTIVGNRPEASCRPLDRALSRHNWRPSLAHSKILELMRMHDVLIFPSLFEGFGLVITEAMSQGMPVITTDRTAGPDFIRNSENGWLIKPSSLDSLVESLDHLLSHPSVVRDAGLCALETARRRPWQTYGHELAAAVVRNLSC